MLPAAMERAYPGAPGGQEAPHPAGDGAVEGVCGFGCRTSARWPFAMRSASSGRCGLPLGSTTPVSGKTRVASGHEDPSARVQGDCRRGRRRPLCIHGPEARQTSRSFRTSFSSLVQGLPHRAPFAGVAGEAARAMRARRVRAERAWKRARSGSDCAFALISYQNRSTRTAERRA